ncbi:hypothetical protein R6258_07725 [Halomonas sp. HP20-15]|uniref:hypothetical protein n=1 Tax=Halomonas sp. HP20-15 TaxID=3085901 RepID=UPI0029818F09|nr:hypothetical protein [Halomonas sp. HP20-15]MDW5376808.1 hypothetical protein [Halomonas sp. HP20-15]
MGQQMQKPHIAKLARRAIDAGATFELVVIVKRTKKSGSVVRMESRDVLPPRSHGSLIRLNGDDHE